MICLVLLCALLSLVSALPAAKRDVWVPPVIRPASGDVWVAGQTYTVSWNTSTKPSQVTNPDGMIFLRHGGETLVDSPLARGFPLTAGAVNVTVPDDTQPGSNWRLVVMGDSGNWSPAFTIVAPSSSGRL